MGQRFHDARSISGVGISRHLTNTPNFQRQELCNQLDSLMFEYTHKQDKWLAYGLLELPDGGALKDKKAALISQGGLF